MFLFLAHFRVVEIISGDVALTTNSGYVPSEQPLLPALGSPVTLVPLGNIGGQELLARKGYVMLIGS